MIPKEFESKEEFIEAFKIATQYTWDKKEMEVYDYIGLKAYDEIHALDTAEKKGIKKGIEKGKELGKNEAKIEIAKNLLKAGIDIETIQISTGLDIETIRNLRDS
jgi:predicted transposase/invertase (TIGR01784 family)